MSTRSCAFYFYGEERSAVREEEEQILESVDPHALCPRAP